MDTLTLTWPATQVFDINPVAQANNSSWNTVTFVTNVGLVKKTATSSAWISWGHLALDSSTAYVIDVLHQQGGTVATVTLAVSYDQGTNWTNLATTITTNGAALRFDHVHFTTGTVDSNKVSLRLTLEGNWAALVNIQVRKQ